MACCFGALINCNVTSNLQFYLDLGKIKHVLKLFDDHVWNRDRSNPEDQFNALGLLIRLHVRQMYIVLLFLSFLSIEMSILEFIRLLRR